MKLNVKFIDSVIVVLFFVSLSATLLLNSKIEPETVKSKELIDYYGKYVRVCGNLSYVKYSPKSETLFLEISDAYGKIRAVKFRTQHMNLSEQLCVEGEVNVYEGYAELVVKRIISFQHNT